MKIDLNNKTVRFLVQEYVNQIYNYTSQKDLNYNLHKLIHTFSVVEMAQELIDATEPALPQKTQKLILNAALLHDLGRCHEFKEGKHLKVDHGKIGANLIKKNFPKMEIEATTTLYHNKCPSNKDPKFCQPILDYVRDADILANIKYEIEKTDIWLSHIVGEDKSILSGSAIDREILKAVKEHRPADANKLNIHTLLTGWLWQLCWKYNLRTKAAFKISKKEKLFIKLRETICNKIVPLVIKNKKEQTKLIKQIQKTFPDLLFK